MAGLAGILYKLRDKQSSNTTNKYTINKYVEQYVKLLTTAEREQIIRE